ncbi:major facilitator superfamily domain-containing protein [Peziza echinospora]|nr:major facilitator superfamily domain-containing protein [Peziza echinospora]
MELAIKILGGPDKERVLNSGGSLEINLRRVNSQNNISTGYVREYTSGIDGIELSPTPTADPLDPLNFSKLEKWVSLGIVMWMYCLFTYLTTTTVPSFPLLQEEYSISFAQVNWTVAIPALGLGLGPLFWSGFADIYGRRIVMITGTLIALLATIWSAVAPNYANYMAARFFQGFGVSPAATVGMAIVNDLFFEHERGQKLGLWVLAIDVGLLIGPLVGGFITLVNQHWVSWLTAILFGILFAAELFLLPETLYPRRYMLSQLPTTAISENMEKQILAPVEFKRTKKLSFFNVSKVPNVQHPEAWAPLVNFIRMWSFPNVAIFVFFYCFAWYWWVLSIITYIPVAYVQYKPETQGLLFIGLILGALMSELLFSGTLGDILMIHFAKHNDGVRIPEARLWLMYPAIVLSAVGLVLWGVSVDRGYHWIVGQVAFFLFAAGMQMGNVVVTAYIVDCHPQHAMSVVTFYSVLLNLSAFANPFFIAPWVDKYGFTWTFAVQCMITFFVMMPVTIILQRFGASWRVKRGQPKWISPEYSS